MSADLEEKLRSLDAQIARVEKEITTAEHNANDITKIFDRDYWRKKEEQLRKKEEQLREEKLVLLRSSLTAVASSGPPRATHAADPALESLHSKLSAVQVTLNEVREGQGQGPGSRPTPSTVGNRTYQLLYANGAWKPIQPDGDAVLTIEESKKLMADAKDRKVLDERRVRGEWVVVEGLTPKLRVLVAKAAEKIQVPLTLVNSERHFWAVDPFGGAPSAPDFFVTHPAMWEEKTGDSDKRVANSGHGFCFGVPKTWDCRDCIEIVGEAKVQMGEKDFQGIGEGLDYLGRIAATGEGTARLARVKSGRVLVFDAEKFYLLRAVDGRGTHCRYGKWTDQGSVTAIVDFIASAADREWALELEAMCIKANVRLCLPTPGSNFACVLGSGGFGRVFRALDENGETVALKLAVGERGVDAISSEIRAHELPALKAAGVTTTMIQQLHRDQSSALVIRPVGIPLPTTKQHALVSALDGLWELSRHQLRHRDARKANVIWIEKDQMALWTDLHKLIGVTDGVQDFQEDVELFATSVDDTKDSRDFAKRVWEAKTAGNTLHALVKAHFF